jgi:hypothetical protein
MIENKRLMIFAILVALPVSLTQSSEDELNWTIEAHPPFIKLGRLTQGRPVPVKVVLKNRSMFGVQKIEKIDTSCSCVDVSLSHNTLSTGQESILEAMIVPKPIAGELKEEVVVQYRNDKRSNVSVLRIPISGQVETYAHISPRSITLPGSGGEEAVAIIVSMGTLVDSWNELKAISSTASIDVSIDRNKDSWHVWLSKSSNNVGKYGSEDGYVDLHFYNKRGVIVYSEKVPLRVKIEPPWSVNPPSFYLPDLKFEKEFKVFFEIRGEASLLSQLSVRAASDQIRHLQTKRNSKGVLGISAIVFPDRKGSFSSKIVVESQSGSHHVPVLGFVK